MQRVLKVRPVYNFFECGKFEWIQIQLFMNAIKKILLNLCGQRTQVNPLEHQSLLMELLMAQEPQAVKNLPRIKLVTFIDIVCLWLFFIGCLNPSFPILISARATLEILIPDFVKQTAEEKPVEGDELEVLLLIRSIDLLIYRFHLLQIQWKKTQIYLFSFSVF